MNKLIFAASLLFVAEALHAAGYCSLSVRVENPSGKEVEARVVIEEQNGWKTERTTTRGVARFCGLGVTPVSVTVGDAACNQVVVRNVPLEWNETRILSVTYDEAPCLVESLPVAACAFLLRFVSVEREAIGSVSFKTERPFTEFHSSDEFGRIFVKIAAGQELLGTASASSHTSTQVRIPCISKNQRLEEIVVMEKNRN
jgi:hypothetical protein